MKNIRIGVFGAKRGYYYFDNLLANNAEIVAVCDKDNNSLERAKNRLAFASLFFYPIKVIVFTILGYI